MRTKPRVSTDSFDEEPEEKMKELYRTLYRLTRTAEKDTFFWRLREYKDICVLRAFISFGTTEIKYSVYRLVFNDPAQREYRLFTNVFNPFAYEASYMSLIILDTTIMGIADLFRRFRGETYETRVSIIPDFGGTDGSVATLGVGRQRKPSLSGKNITWDLARRLQRFPSFSLLINFLGRPISHSVKFLQIVRMQDAY